MAAWTVERARDLVVGYSYARAAGHGETAVLEIAGTLNMSQRSAENLLGQALLLMSQPALVAAITTGRLGHFHALVLLEEISGLSAEVAAHVVDDVVAKSAGLPPARVRQLARRAALRLDPGGADRRHRAAQAGRTFTVSPGQDGMAWVTLLVRAEAALQIVHRAAEATRADDGSGRNSDQRRADWAVEQLLRGPTLTTETGDGPAPPLDNRRRRPTQVLVQVPVAVGLGLSDDPGELAEYGPIDAGHARALLAEAELRKVCVDATTGDVLHVEDIVVRPVADPTRVLALGGGSAACEQARAEAVRAALIAMVTTPSLTAAGPEPGYRPSAALSRAVKIRSVRCDGVGCSQPARHCDDDHTIAYPRGETSLANLRSRSRRCHRAKQAGWVPTPTPDGGTRWVSPCGRSYLVPSPHAPPPFCGATSPRRR